MGIYITRLPSAYQEVEYIESSGTQYIDTGFNPSSNTEIRGSITPTAKYTLQDYDKWYGAKSNDGIYEMFIQHNKGLGGSGDGKIRALNYKNNQTSSYYVDSLNSLNYGTNYEFVHNKDSFYLNGILQGSFGSKPTYSINQSLFIFTLHRSSGTPVQLLVGKLYYFKIYESGTLIRDFVPCYRKSDNEVGLYDLVNSVFYTNSGTGTFSKGANVHNNTEVKNIYIGGGNRIQLGF